MLKQVTYQNVGLKSQELIDEHEKTWNFMFVQIRNADGLPLECTKNLIRHNDEII